jgi:quercetin dioxygenase-like cupin family protein
MYKLAGVGVQRPTLLMVLLCLAMLSDPSAKIKNRADPMPGRGQNVMAAYGADIVMIDRNARDFKLPDQIEWKGRPGSANQSATVFGNPSSPGFVVQFLKRGPNDWARPHSHPYDRIITVLQGTFLIGTGTNYDRNNTVALGPGSVVKDFANQMHFDGTGSDGATIEIITMGPTSAAPSEAK